MAVSALLAATLLALYGVFEFAAREKARDIQILQTQLNIVADSRAQAVDQWLRAQYAVLAGLADNESLQIYTKLVTPGETGEPIDTDPASLDYLRTLLEVTASRSGFQPRRTGPALPANVNPLGEAGIGLIDPHGTPIVATAGLPPLSGRLAEFVARVPVAERGLLDLHPDHGDRLRLGLVVPVLAATEEADTTQVIARLIGLRGVDAEFFATLEQPGTTAASAETYLIRRAGNSIEYLSPLADGARPLSRRLALNTPALIDVEALTAPGRFHQGRDYAAHPAFAVSRQVPGTDWVLVHKVAQDEALAATDARRTTLLAAMTLIVVVVAATLIVVWRYASSVRAEEAAQQARASAKRNEELSNFLEVLMDNQPLPIFAVDGDGRIIFANQRLADLVGTPKDKLTDRALLGILGQERDMRYLQINRQVLDRGEPTTEVSRFPLAEGGEQVWRSYHAPLPATAERGAAVLTSIEDLTDLMRERAQREHNTRQLIETLVGLVDERDPDAAHQSRHVAELARRIAEQVGFDAAMIEATVQAARLVNIGKIRVPRTLLTKQGELTDTERLHIRQALDEGPELLKHIDFDGPVLDTLRQINERVDGQGPQGLHGEQILLSAQAVALANTFVALVSPRAFRDGKTLAEAESILLTEIDQRFDRRVVLGLLNYLNNQGGRAHWAALSGGD
nr:HD domain-containing phosphohydrolase [Marichromatium bheemlicum]